MHSFVFAFFGGSANVSFLGVSRLPHSPARQPVIYNYINKITYIYKYDLLLYIYVKYFLKYLTFLLFDILRAELFKYLEGISFLSFTL